MIVAYMRLRRKRTRGFTLMEVVVATAYVAVGIVGLMSAFFVGLALVESSRNTAEAGAHARLVLEEIRRESGSGLNAVVSKDWASWVTREGLTTLPSEAIRVDVRNRNADPAEVTVTITWLERSRSKSVSMGGAVTTR